MKDDLKEARGAIIGVLIGCYIWLLLYLLVR